MLFKIKSQEEREALRAHRKERFEEAVDKAIDWYCCEVEEKIEPKIPKRFPLFGLGGLLLILNSAFWSIVGILISRCFY